MTLITVSKYLQLLPSKTSSSLAIQLPVRILLPFAQNELLVNLLLMSVFFSFLTLPINFSFALFHIIHHLFFWGGGLLCPKKDTFILLSFDTAHCSVAVFYS